MVSLLLLPDRPPDHVSTERKHSRTTGRKSNGDDGTDFFLSVTIRAFFQAGGETLYVNDALNDLVLLLTGS